MSKDFSRIEHDFLHSKNCFSNYKFIYKERKSRLDFFQNINNDVIQDSTELLIYPLRNNWYRLSQVIKILIMILKR